VEGKLGELKIY